MFEYRGGVTTFVEHTTEAGTLFLPEAVACTSRCGAKLHDGEVFAAVARSPRTATDEQCLELLAAARRRRAEADAYEAEALARLTTIRDGDRYVADEAALELRVSRHHAGDRLERAETLTRRLPGEHGMSTLLASLPAEVAASAYAHVDALAAPRRHRAGDDDEPAQRAAQGHHRH